MNSNNNNPNANKLPPKNRAVRRGGGDDVTKANKESEQKQGMRRGDNGNGQSGSNNICSKQPLYVAIENEPFRRGPRDGCFRCGLPGHKASKCPNGGAWHRMVFVGDKQGRNVHYHKEGGKPRCFVCARNADHMSATCPYRHPDSFKALKVCPGCGVDLQGRNSGTSCPKCATWLRCWNCGKTGHPLRECEAPRYKPGTSVRAPREENK